MPFLKEPCFVTFKFPKHLRITANKMPPRTKFKCSNRPQDSVTWQSYLLFREDHKIFALKKKPKKHRGVQPEPEWWSK